MDILELILPDEISSKNSSGLNKFYFQLTSYNDIALALGPGRLLIVSFS